MQKHPQASRGSGKNGLSSGTEQPRDGVAKDRRTRPHEDLKERPSSAAPELSSQGASQWKEEGVTPQGHDLGSSPALHHRMTLGKSGGLSQPPQAPHVIRKQQFPPARCCREKHTRKIQEQNVYMSRAGCIWPVTQIKRGMEPRKVNPCRRQWKLLNQLSKNIKLRSAAWMRRADAYRRLPSLTFPTSEEEEEIQTELPPLPPQMCTEHLSAMCCVGHWA